MGQLTVFFERSLLEKHDSLVEPPPLLKGRSQLMSIKQQQPHIQQLLAEASLELNLKNRPLRPSSFLQGEESNGYWSSEGYFDFDYTTRRELRQSRVRGGTHPKKEKRKPSNDGGWTKNQEGNSLICRYKRISQLTPLLRRSSQVSRKHRCKSSLTVQSRFFCNDRFTILLRHQPNNSSIK